MNGGGMTTFPRLIKAVLLTATIVLMAGSAWYYRAQKERRFQEAAANLESIARLKIEWIREWRKERMLEAYQTSASRFYSPILGKWTKEPPRPEEIKAIEQGLRLFQEQRGFIDAVFVDAGGKILFRLSKRSEDLSKESQIGLAEAFRLGKSVLTDFYALPGNPDQQLDLIAPFIGNSSNPTIPNNAIIFQYAAKTLLSTAIQSWPIKTASAETILVRHEGNTLLALNELRFRKNAALKLRFPISAANVLGHKELLIPGTAIATKDYRGVNVIVVVKSVPDTPWLMLAKQDESEIFSSLRHEFILMLIGALLLITAVSMALGILWQRKNREHYQELYEAESAQRKAEERIRSTMDVMLEGCQIIDFNWRQTYINDAVIKFSKRKKEELLGHTLMESYPGIESTEVFSAFQRCMTERNPQHIANAMVQQDGMDRWFEFSIQPVPEGIFVLTNDVTEQMKVEIENNRLVSAIEQSGEVVVIIDTNRIVQYINPSFESITGYKIEEAVGKLLPQFDTQDAEFYRNFWSILESGKQWRGQLRNRKKDGSLYIEDATVSPVFDRSGAIVNYVSIARDITNFIKLQEEKEKLQNQYLQAQKMESVGRLAGGVAHDFNNMLSVILGYAQLSLDQLEPDHILHSYLQEIQQAANRSADLTRQLLAFARKQTIAPVVLNLNLAIQGTMSMLQRIIGENIVLSWAPGIELWPVKVDPSQIDQMLANLAVNARDAIAEHGRIIIETQNIAFTTENKSANYDCIIGEYVMLALSDNGIGMPQEVKDHLFEPFFTTKERGKGTGLGLATVYGIVNQNGGFVNVYSEVGQGTTFKMYFPRYTGIDTTPSPAAKKERPKGGTETVLLVEDEPSVLTLAKTILERLGYVVIAANTPGKAMEIIETYSGEIQLLLVDVVMPQMTGRELADKISEKFPKIKKLYMSGYTADAIAHHGVLDAGVSFLQKPFSSGAMAAKIREVLEF
jgi:two-component system, cell cycle sensor histidine kinase and response regulator CckA